ncbi:hypothetical protein BH09PSE6_BH09PSE6_22010 [soil metagenome]
MPVVIAQPVNQSATAGDPVTFAVDARCPAGRLQVQWQQLDGSDFIDIAKAVRERLTFDTSTDDSGARFRAWLSCDGKSEVLTRIVALTVPTPTAALLMP